jgi:hypothetical protein
MRQRSLTRFAEAPAAIDAIAVYFAFVFIALRVLRAAAALS